MSNYQIVYWRDIPAQIKIRNAELRSNTVLPARFQEAIDAAAMTGKLTSTDAYLEAWRATQWQESDENPDELAARLLNQFERKYPQERLDRLVRQSGQEIDPG